VQGGNIESRPIVSGTRHRLGLRVAIWKGLIGLATVCAAGSALNNVLSYRLLLQQRESQADGIAASFEDRKGQGEGGNTDILVRHNLYALLERLGRDPSLHRGDTGVYVADPAFFEGAYIDRPSDTILDRCAIQPFSIPALTGMPLVAGLRARHNGCKYESYAYQYLPPREIAEAAILTKPCALAQLRGLQKVVVIERTNTNFTASRLDCAKP
jgi:hypothetical protein